MMSLYNVRSLRRAALILTAAITALDVLYAVPVNGRYRDLYGDEYLNAHRKIVRVAGPAAPIMALPLIVTYLVSLYRSSRDRSFVLASLVCLLANAGITFAVNVPINREFVRSPADSPPEDWKNLRDRWAKAHNIRTTAQVAGLISTIVWTTRTDTTERN